MKTKMTQSKNRTRKNKGKQSEATIVLTFIQMLNTVKLYHWKTYSYAQHKATDKLYDDLNDHIDKFMEVMLGKQTTRVDLSAIKNLRLLDFNNVQQLKKQVESYKAFLINMDAKFDAHMNSDLLNIRDEILGDLNQFSYLLTLDK